MIKNYFKTQIKIIDKALDRYLPASRKSPAVLHEAMRYSVFGKGKRVRPLLALASSDLCGGSRERALIPACAIEMIPSYSLVHDDLPSMDDDDTRRGRPTCHKKYGEANAILVGDGLLTEAFHLLGRYPDPKKAVRLIQILAEAAGSRGMIAGQVIEKMLEGKDLNLPTTNLIHVNKTGKLIMASCLAGAVSAGAFPSQERHIRRYGEYIGFAFQIVDDIMDKDGYLKLMSASEARKEVALLTQKARAELRSFGKKADTLLTLADFLGARTQ